MSKQALKRAILSPPAPSILSFRPVRHPPKSSKKRSTGAAELRRTPEAPGHDCFPRSANARAYGITGRALRQSINARPSQRRRSPAHTAQGDGLHFFPRPACPPGSVFCASRRPATFFPLPRSELRCTPFNNGPGANTPHSSERPVPAAPSSHRAPLPSPNSPRRSASAQKAFLLTERTKKGRPQRRPFLEKHVGVPQQRAERYSVQARSMIFLRSSPGRMPRLLSRTKWMKPMISGRWPYSASSCMSASGRGMPEYHVMR